MMSIHRVIAALVLSFIALAGGPLAARADAVGAWALSYTTKDGVKMESTLTVTMDGGKLAGTISSPRGSVALNEITVTGDDIAFAILRVGFGDSIRIAYAGKITGDGMKLTMKAGTREPLEVVGKRK